MPPRRRYPSIRLGFGCYPEAGARRGCHTKAGSVEGGGADNRRATGAEATFVHCKNKCKNKLRNNGRSGEVFPELGSEPTDGTSREQLADHPLAAEYLPDA